MAEGIALVSSRMARSVQAVLGDSGKGDSSVVEHWMSEVPGSIPGISSPRVSVGWFFENLYFCCQVDNARLGIPIIRFTRRWLLVFMQVMGEAV